MDPTPEEAEEVLRHEAQRLGIPLVTFLLGAQHYTDASLILAEYKRKFGAKPKE